MFLINIETPLGTSLQATNQVAYYVEKEIKNIPDLKNYATNVGRGNPRIYYNVMPQNEVSNYAQLFVQLKETPPAEKRKLDRSAAGEV